MIINKEYILSRIKALSTKGEANQTSEQQSIGKILRIKYALPKWLRQMIFSPYNPLFAIAKQRRLSEKEKNLKVPTSIFAINFVIDCLLENIKLDFDTSLFYENQDDEITKFIDNRIICALNIFEYLPITKKQKEDKENMLKVSKMVKKNNSYYSLSIKDNIYYLPKSLFSHYVFIQHYGLIYFPSFAQYIKDKVFLDIGAYFGDTSLMFTQYNPSVIYAYEPESQNYNLLKSTIEKNKIENKVIPVKKGLGDKKGNFYISNSGSASTLNENLQTNSNSESIEISTLDDDFENIQIGLIKMDVEGFEYNVIKGGLNIIKKNNPIMIISMYHTAKDFFEIPPMILSSCPNYKFKLIDLEPSDLITEKVLFCYPSFLKV